MWVLSCSDPSIFLGKRPWLRPGTEYLIGRTKPDKGLEKNQRFGAISEVKSISRQHLVLRVKEVVPGSGTSIDSKPDLLIVDSSKIGTTLNGEKFKQDTRPLRGNKHELKLGNWEHLIIAEWVPKVFTITSAGSSKKRIDEPLADVRTKIEHLGFKFTQDYLSAKTTHVVAAKRNLPQNLSGLVDGRFLVTSDFIDAVVARADAAQRDDEPGTQDFSSLEEDIGNWPDESDHVPPPGKEPVIRPAEALAPNNSRKEVFSGYTFVFCEPKQFESLQEPITLGGGKALVYEAFDYGNTPVADFVAYVKKVAGEKGLGELEDGSEGKGVVVVRLAEDKKQEDGQWRINFVQQVDLMLGQRSILQNEFLDAIVGNDASGLRKPLEEEPEVSTSQISASAQRATDPQRPTSPQTGATQRQASIKTSTRTEPMPETVMPRRRPPPRSITRSRLQKFDDFDPSQISRDVGPADEDVDMDTVSFTSQGRDHDQSQSQINNNARQSHATRKRAAEMSDVIEVEDEEPGLDNLLPATTAMKRRKIDAGETATHAAKENVKPDEGAIRKARKSRKKSPEIDVREVARQRREAVDEKARLDDEALREDLNQMDITSMRDLAQVEEMDILPRSASRSATNSRSVLGDGDSGRWKAEWNGRKNFKKFRSKVDRAGIEPGISIEQRGSRIMVPLEEVKKKAFGLGDEYWLAEPSQRPASRSRASQAGRANQAASQSMASTARNRGDTRGQSQQQVAHTVSDDDDGDDSQFRMRRNRRLAQQTAEQHQREDDLVDELVNPEHTASATSRIPETALSHHTRNTPRSQLSTQTQRGSGVSKVVETQPRGTAQSGKAKGKRPAVEAPKQQNPPKRLRGAASKDDDGSSDDELKFRFRSRR